MTLAREAVPGGAPAPRSIYQRALGTRFDDLDAELRRYFGPIPAGSVGLGEGVYDTAGPRLPRWVRPVLAWSAHRAVLFPESGHDVPFTVVNAPRPDGALSAARRFVFPTVTRVMLDEMTVRDGVLVDRLGRRGGLEVHLAPAVVAGGMTLTSTRLAVRAFGVRIPLPRMAGVAVREQVDPADRTRQRVDVRIRVALLGEVFRYTGAFAYRIVDATDSGLPVSTAVPRLFSWLTENAPNRPSTTPVPKRTR